MINPLAFLSRLALQAGCLAGAGACLAASVLHHPWPLLLAALVAFACLRKRPPSDAYGSARWATADDLAKANLFGQRSGLPLGYADAAERPGLGCGLRCLFNPRLRSDPAARLFLSGLGCRGFFAGQPLRWADGVHAAVFAAPGAGKSTAWFIPALLSCPEPAFVLDIKGDLAQKTARFRAKRFGHKIYITDPYHLLGSGTHSYNPLVGIDPASPTAADELRDLANAIAYRTGREPDTYWLDQAELVLFAGMAFALTHGQPEQRHLVEVLEIIADSEARTAAIEAMTQSDAWGGTLRRMGHQLAQLRDREGASVMSSALRQLNFLHSQPIADCLRQSSFDPGELIHGKAKATVYLVIPPDHIQSQASYLRLILAGVLSRVFREGPSQRRCVRVFLDEAAALGKMPCIDQALSVGRSYGIKLCFAYQSMGQLLTCYPEGQHQTFLSCLGCQIFLGAPSDYQTAELLQNLLGDRTIQITSSQDSHSRSWSSGGQSPQEQRSTSRSVTYSEHGRKLLQAAEAFHLLPRQAIVFLPGLCRPVITTMRRYFEDRSLTAGRMRRFARQLRLFFAALMFLGVNAVLWVALATPGQERRAAPPSRPIKNHPPPIQPLPGPHRPMPPFNPPFQPPPAPPQRRHRAGDLVNPRFRPRGTRND